MAIDRAAIRSRLAGSAATSYAHKDSDASFRGYVKLPDAYKDRPIFRKLPEGDIMMDFIPFVISADWGLDEHGQPIYRQGDVKYFLEVWAHTNVGVNNVAVVCPNRNFGLPCPICQEATRLQNAGADWKTVIGPLKPKRRCVYNIWFHDIPARKEENKGVQILEIAHFSLEEKIIPLTRDPLTGAFIEIADPDVGQTVFFQRQGTKMDNTKYLGHRLLPRQYPIPDEILAQAVPVNECIELLDYDKLLELMEGAATPATPAAATTAAGAENSRYRQPPMAAPAQPAGPIAEAPKYGPTAAVPPAQPAAPVTPPTAPPVAAPVTPVTAPAAAAPVRPPRRPAATPTAAPTPAPTPAAAPAQSVTQVAAPAAVGPSEGGGDPVCPHGGVFGGDIDRLAQCKDCGEYNACGAAYDAAQ